jgi:Ca2+-dependent lipid-binding protein
MGQMSPGKHRPSSRPCSSTPWCTPTSVNNQKFKSKVEKKTNDPVFGDSFTFEDVKGKLCQLVVTVYHKNFIASDSQVGQATVPRQDVYGAHGVEQTFTLESHTGVTAGKQVGSITLNISVA